MFNEAPKFIRQLQQPETAAAQHPAGHQDRASTPSPASRPTSRPAITAGRPVTSNSVPTAHRARKLVYAPDLDGRADPGEIVWTWVVYEDDPTRGKDRPVLVVGRDRRTLLGLMLSSQEHHDDDRDWVGIGAGSWDYEGRASWVRLDRVLDVPEEGIRREGAILDARRSRSSRRGCAPTTPGADLARRPPHRNHLGPPGTRSHRSARSRTACSTGSAIPRSLRDMPGHARRRSGPSVNASAPARSLRRAPRVAADDHQIPVR